MALSLSRELFMLSCIRTCDFRKKLASPNPGVAFLALAVRVVLPGRVVSENSCSSYLRRVFELGKIVSIMTARPLEYPNNSLI